jgi:hypothetical protein
VYGLTILAPIVEKPSPELAPSTLAVACTNSLVFAATDTVQVFSQQLIHIQIHVLTDIYWHLLHESLQEEELSNVLKDVELTAADKQKELLVLTKRQQDLVMGEQEVSATLACIDVLTCECQRRLACK